MMKQFYQPHLFLWAAIGLGVLACAPNKKQDLSSTDSTSNKYLYVVSGGCYAGGVTTMTASNTVVRYHLETGAFDRIVYDYGSTATGDVPVRIVNYDSEHLLVLVENTGGRRVDLLHKTQGNITLFLTNSTAFNAQLRSLVLLPDLSILISKSTAIEKFSPAKVRILKGTNPYISAPGGSCATSTSLISSLDVLPNGKILYAHAAASPNNKLGLISASGYSGVSDCLSSQNAPTTTALPTGVLLHSSGKLLVTYGSTTVTSNFIYSYNLDINTNAFSAATVAFNDTTFIYGPSALAEDTDTGHVFVASAINTHNTIEKFELDATAGTLIRLTNLPFVGPNLFTRCVSSILIAD